MKRRGDPLFFERYELMERLGAGGMGSVYRAFDTRLKRFVACKQLELIDSPGLEERFEREAQNMAQLDHPHIASVYDASYPFLVMQLVEGEDLLRTLSREEFLTIDAVLRLGVEMADALNCLEEHKIIHRDIKPANIIIKPDGSAVLADFGIALNVEQIRLTLHGSLGTPSHMSPEQAEGDKDVDHRCDIYSLGMVLYRCLTGLMPKRTEEGSIPAIQSIRPEVPGWLDAIILQCLEADRKYRFQTAQALKQALLRQGKAKPIQPSPVLLSKEGRKSETVIRSAEQLYEAGRYSDAKEKYLQALQFDPENASILAQIGACDRQIKTFIPGEPEPDKGSSKKRDDRAGLEQEKKLVPARSMDWRVAVGGLAVLLLASALVWGITRTKNPELASKSEPEQEEITSIEEEPFSGQLLAQPVELTRHINGVHSVAFSPDGAIFASGGDDTTIQLWEAGTNEPSHTLIGHRGRVQAVAFSPVDNRLASAGNDGVVLLWELSSGEEITTFGGASHSSRTVAFSPDGAWLATGGVDRVIRIWEVATGELENEFKGMTLATRSLAFSPDGTWLAAGDLGKIHLWNMESGQHIEMLDGHSDGVSAVAFSPDGSLLASGSEDKTIGVWDVATRELLRTITASKNWVRSVAFSPDGVLLASTDHHAVRFWEVATGQERQSLEGHSGPVNAVAFSPDGDWLASASDDETVRLWPLK